ncbi:MAG: ABC transporter permease [Methylobacterium frigidaeris]|uniref:ABC transporter permease n=1 Tax=Methylobacterium oryzihabitans TaxID=2499852 RepID=A0A3S2VBX3_9HYPH|nr:ABC transporter permease [Methylobacterium oryzihabitans]RVU19149.1 ABC transporter permease [Methylobacterium oryzihabitans]
MTASSLPAGPVAARPQPVWRRHVRAFLRDPLALLGLAVLVLAGGAALLAPFIAPQNPYDLATLDIMDAGMPPGSQSFSGMTYWLGTDAQGRDMLSAIIYGLRVSLVVSLSATLIAVSVGASLGILAAHAGGRVDALLMRLVDLQLSFPAILIALILLASFGRGVDKVVIALVAVQWAYYARAIRSAALVERRRDYMEAARALALPTRSLIFRHLLPNCLSPVIVVATMQVAHAIALEATLSFLGVGVPVTEPSLGLLIKNGYDYLLSGKYWISTFPGIALVTVIVAINLVGDRLRDVLNPRLAA